MDITNQTEEDKNNSSICPSTELARDEKGMLFYRLEDFEKIFR